MPRPGCIRQWWVYWEYLPGQILVSSASFVNLLPGLWVPAAMPLTVKIEYVCLGMKPPYRAFVAYILYTTYIYKPFRRLLVGYRGIPFIKSPSVR
jgi:hypothetical protein